MYRAKYLTSKHMTESCQPRFIQSGKSCHYRLGANLHGHALGTSAAIELIATLRGLEIAKALPTVNNLELAADFANK